MKYSKISKMRFQLLVLLTLAIFVTSSATVATANLIAYWPLDDGAGNTAADTVGNFDGTVQGNPVWDGNGQVAGALVLDGDGDYIQTTLFDELHTAENFTIAAWFQTNVTDSGQQHILWIGDVGGNGWGSHQELHIGVNHFNSLFNNKVIGYFGSGGDTDGFNINIVSKDDFTDTSGWHHLALVIKNASGPTVTGSLYLDGEWVEPLVDGFVNNDGALFPTTDSADPPDRAEWNTALRIGSPGNLSRFFNGMVDDVVVLTRALNPGNIKFLMENDPTTAVEPGGKLTTTWGEIK